MKPIKLLYLSHRWLGITMCLFLTMWCASGMVMMYVSFPQLTKDEYYAGLEPLAVDRIHTTPEKLLQQMPAQTTVEQLLLTSSASRPVYLLKMAGASWLGMYADTGEMIRSLSANEAVDVAVEFYKKQHASETVTGKHEQQLDMDQWTVSSGLHPYRPLHRVSVHDTSLSANIGAELYVSSLTGQVVRDTTQYERVWNWLGANLHWIYPMQLRKHRTLWVNVIIVLTLVSLAAVITGGIIGFKRLRLKRRYRNGSSTPYRGMAKYHHLLGLFALVFLLTFLFSGLMSVGPWGVFDSNSSFAEQRQRYEQQNKSIPATLAYVQLEEIKQLIQQNPHLSVKQIAWHWIGGQSYVSLYGSKQTVEYRLPPDDTETLKEKIQYQIGNLIPNSKIVEQQQLTRYDLYYYSRHNRHRPLPVLRVKFDDPESTWFHIDMSTGEILNRLTDRRRLERWIYNGLHTFDFTFLIYNRPAWDLWMILLCGFGLVFSATSVAVGVRYFTKKW